MTSTENKNFDWHTIADKLTDIREYAVLTNSQILIKNLHDIGIDDIHFHSLDEALDYLKKKAKKNYDISKV